jgi:hypothetical protein
MIVSVNPEPERSHFTTLLSVTLEELGKLATNSPESILKLEGRNFEPLVKEVLDEKAKGTLFEDSIELIGGQKFPDIVAKKFYGIEVKTTKQNHWRTTGNSVFEGTRVEGVERIFMLFAKLFNPIELKCRPYEEVLSEVVVTHSPRYLIDMNLNAGHTVFDKIQVPYDTLRKMDNPIRPIVDYYRTQLSPGEDLWWMDQSADAPASNLIIRIWSNLSRQEREELRDKAISFFPIQLSNQPTKYSKMAIWLLTREGVVCPNIRDMYSAGGQGTIHVSGREINNVPRIIIHLMERLPAIKLQVLNTPASQLSEFWGLPTTEETKWTDWMKLAGSYFNRNLGRLSLYEIILEMEIN